MYVFFVDGFCLSSARISCKNANVFPPFAIICFAMAVYPFEDEVWFPIYKVVIKKSPLLVSEKLLTEAPKVLILSLNDKY